MGYLRNLFSFMIFSLIITGCGGGNTTISNNNASSSSTGTGSGGTSSGGSSTSYGSVTLKWTPPSSLADGTTAISLSDVSGYKLFYGSSPTNTPNVISINNATTSQYTITLPTGSYYFVICAIDNNGNSGLKSGALQKSI